MERACKMEGTPGKMVQMVMTGKDGKDGNDGKDGTSVSIKGAKDTESYPEVSNPALGDGYLINGDLWV